MEKEEKIGQFTVLFEAICQKLATRGLTKDEVKFLEGNPVGCSDFKTFVGLNLKLGNWEWREGKLFNVERKFILGLNQTEENLLRIRAQRAGQTEEAYINDKIIKALLND